MICTYIFCKRNSSKKLKHYQMLLHVEKIRTSDKFQERQDKRGRRTHFDKKSDIFYQEMMVFVPIAILLKCIPDKSASRRGFNQNFSRKMTKAYQPECAPNLKYFFAVNFYQTKKRNLSSYDIPLPASKFASFFGN